MCRDIKTYEKCGYQLLRPIRSSRAHRKIMCGKCSDTFTTEKNMKKHNYSHTNRKPQKCPDCGVGFIKDLR